MSSPDYLLHALRSASFANKNLDLVIEHLIQLGASKAQANEIFSLLLRCTDDARPSAKKDIDRWELTKRINRLPNYHAVDHFRAMISKG